MSNTSLIQLLESVLGRSKTTNKGNIAVCCPFCQSSKKKLEIGDYHTGIKSLFHSLRIPIFSTQIVKTGEIDFSSANYIWDKLKSKVWNWEELDLEFREMRNNILTEFRKVTEK